MSRERIAANPFYVLELSPDCSRIEIERNGQKLLAMLGVGIGDAGQYATPFGPRPRTPELVREAMAALRDPRRRLIAEMWARQTTTTTTAAPPEPAAPETTAGAADDGEPGWPNAMAAMGLRGRR